MEKNLKKFSKVLQIVAIVMFGLNIILRIMAVDYLKSVIIALIISVAVFVLLLLKIASKIKTIIVVPILITPIISPFFASTTDFFWLTFFSAFPYFYPSLVLLLVNSWLRELAHLDSPKQDKIDKLKKRLESLESDDKQE